MRVGFIGLGLMGEPMATNLARAGHDLWVWNRSEPAIARLAALGASRAESPWHVVGRSDATVVMLSTEQVIEDVLQPKGSSFAEAIAGRGLVHMGTTSPDFSSRLGESVRANGGWYVEAPVSGSRAPAQTGQLVAMAAGDEVHLDELDDMFGAMCRLVLRCGAPPSAMRMKFAVNIYLIAVVTALAEAYHFAQAHDLHLEVFATAINSGQMASPIAAVKLDKLQRGDFSPQAAIPDVYRNNRLIAEAARRARLSTPVLDACHDLFRETTEQGLDELDMIGVLRAIQLRTDRIRTAQPPAGNAPPHF
jgi:3-hydroxyisobutyrate dehydrogenase